MVEEVKYPYFDKPFIGKEIRPYMWQLTDPFTYFRSDKESYTPPVNYVTDGYSIPKGFRWLIPKGLPAKRVPTLHDWFCEMGKRGEPIIDSKSAHAIFGESLALEEGISGWRKKGMAWAVKCFGPRW